MSSIIIQYQELNCNAVYRENDNSVSVTYDGTKIAKIHDGKCEKTSELFGEESEKFLRINRLCENVSNYCSAYENGKPINIPNFSDGYRIIYQVGGAEMAARFDRKSGFEFVIFNGDESFNFSVNYDDAREKFAILSGLVDREKIFDDEELQILYYCVFVTLEINDALNEDMLELLREVKRKLDIAISKNLSAEKGEKYESAV